MFLIEYLKGEESGKEPAACNVEVVGSNEDTG